MKLEAQGRKSDSWITWEKKVFWGKYGKQSQDKSGSEQGFWNLKKKILLGLSENSIK